MLLSVSSVLSGASESPSAKAEAAADASRADSARTAGAKVDYVLKPQDVIRVRVFGEDDINKQGEVRISQEWTVTLPLIGTVDLKNKTERQAEEIIRRRYDADYLVKLVVPNLKALSRILNDVFLAHPVVQHVRSAIVLDHIKHSSQLPLQHLGRPLGSV